MAPGLTWVRINLSVINIVISQMTNRAGIDQAPLKASLCHSFVLLTLQGILL